MEHAQLTEGIIGGAMKAHRTLGPGFLESVYKNALAYELHSRGLDVEREKRLRVQYEGVIVGEFVVDMLVDDVVLVEVKAVRAIAPGHEAQLVNYLTAVSIETGLVLNFGSDRLQFKRKTRTYRPRAERQRGQEVASANASVAVSVVPILSSCQRSSEGPPATP